MRQYFLIDPVSRQIKKALVTMPRSTKRSKLFYGCVHTGRFSIIHYLDGILGEQDGAVVEHLPPTQASYQCLIPGVGVICGLRLLLVLVLAPRGFSPSTPVFPSPQKPTFPNSISIWKFRTSIPEKHYSEWSLLTKYYYLFI